MRTKRTKRGTLVTKMHKLHIKQVRTMRGIMQALLCRLHTTKEDTKATLGGADRLHRLTPGMAKTPTTRLLNSPGRTLKTLAQINRTASGLMKTTTETRPPLVTMGHPHTQRRITAGNGDIHLHKTVSDMMQILRTTKSSHPLLDAVCSFVSFVLH